MAQNTIYNKSTVASVVYNMVFGLDDPNNLDIFTKPTTSNATAQQIADFCFRSGSSATKIADCRFASTTQLTTTYSNGTLGVGATLTNAGTQAALVVDGYTAVVGDRFLYWTDTSNPYKNGIYTVTNIGSASTNWVLTRATDYDTVSEALFGTFTNITNGNSLAGKKFLQLGAPATMGTDGIVFKLSASVLLSGTNYMYLSGAYGLILNLTANSIITLPSGTKTLLAVGDNIDNTLIGSTTPLAAKFTSLYTSIGSAATTGYVTSTLSFNFTAVLNSSTTETTLMTYTLPANTFTTTNQLLEHEFSGIFISSVNAKTVKVYFGATVVGTLSLPVSTAGSYMGKLRVVRTGLSAQAWQLDIHRIATGGGATMACTVGTTTETETNAIVMKLTGTGGASSEINQQYVNIKSTAN